MPTGVVGIAINERLQMRRVRGSPVSISGTRSECPDLLGELHERQPRRPTRQSREGLATAFSALLPRHRVRVPTRCTALLG